MLVSGLFNLKFIKGFCVGGASGHGTLFLCPWQLTGGGRAGP